MSESRRILVGEFGRPHGVRGLIHVRSFTAEPAAIAAYGSLSDEGGARSFALKWLSEGLVQVEGVADRDAAAAELVHRRCGERLRRDGERRNEPAEEQHAAQRGMREHGAETTERVAEQRPPRPGKRAGGTG